MHGENIILDRAYVNNLKLIDFGTSIFSGIENSHKRDARMLFELCYKVLPELRMLTFIRINPEEYNSSIIRELLYKTLPIVYSMTEEYKTFDKYTFKERFEFPLSIIQLEHPFIRGDDTKEFLDKLK